MGAGSKADHVRYPLLIVGAGESGLGLGCQLKRKFGMDNFKIVDRQSGIGGKLSRIVKNVMLGLLKESQGLGS